MPRLLGNIVLVLSCSLGTVFLVLLIFLFLNDLQQAFQLPRETIAIFSAIGCFMTAVQLAWRLVQAMSGRPSFTVAPAGTVLNALRVRVTNSSSIVSVVTARGVAFYGGMESEAISLIWEESNTERMTLNPGDHGNLFIGDFIIAELSPPQSELRYHAVRFLSSHLGQPVRPQFGHHFSNEPEMEMLLLVTISADKLPTGRRDWKFIIRDDHATWRGFIETVSAPAEPFLARVQSILGRIHLSE
ncbi:MAG: hypothetical protein HY666_02840 [Chloroflexi bacterium]|nr:hypothetical protein [Chloroflexota bacterium]